MFKESGLLRDKKKGGDQTFWESSIINPFTVGKMRASNASTELGWET